MHLYIYDDFLNKNRYNKSLSKIETRLTDLGLSGKIIRLNNLKNSDKAIQEEIKQGAKTLVAVGNDKTLNKTINVIMNDDLSYFTKDMVVAFIPVSESSLSDSLGLQNSQQACDVLLARRIEKINLGKCGDNYFLSHVKIFKENANLLINHSYQITLLKNKGCYVVNIATKDLFKKIPNISEKNKEKLFLFIENGKEDYSFLPINNLKIEKQDNLSLLFDNCFSCEPPTEIFLDKKNIKLIVGKNRTF